MSQTDLEHWLANRRRQTTVKLQQEVRALPMLDPGTDRPDDTEVWLSIAHANSAVISILALSDEELCRHTDDLRKMAQAINTRITSIED